MTEVRSSDHHESARLPLGGACRYEPPPPEQPFRFTRWLVPNFILVVVIGVVVSAWLYWYTDLFAEALTLLALGGILSWLGVLLKVVPEDATKAVQAALVNRLFRSFWFLVFLVAVGLALLLFFRGVGSIEVVAAEGDADRPVQVTRVTETAEEQDTVWLPVGKPARFNFVGPPFSRQQVRVKVEGYPSKIVSLCPWRLEELRAPQSFRRRVILLRPTLAFLQAHADPQNELPIFVTVGGKTYQSTIGARAIWVGCEQDVAVPAGVEATWFAQNKPEDYPLITQFWLKPKALAGGPQDALPEENLSDPKTRITVEFEDKHGKRHPVKVGAWKRDDPFPQVVDVNEPGG